MIDCLVSGKLIRDPQLKTGPSGKNYCQFLIVSTESDVQTIVGGIAFVDIAERIAKLKKGDALSVTGSLNTSEWIDKTTGEAKHGLNIVVNNALSIYDIKKRRPAQDAAPKTGNAAHPFDDNFDF